MFEFITNSEERGQVGIGTLIVFIAMVLVAAIAAGVLINTAGFLQTQAEATGEESTDLVSERIDVTSEVGIVADDSDGLDAGELEAIRVTVSSAAGADDIDLSETTIQAVGPEGQANMVFAESDAEDNGDFTDGDDVTASELPQGEFAIVDGDGYVENPVLDSTNEFTIVFNPFAEPFGELEGDVHDGTDFPSHDEDEAFGEGQEATLDIVSPAGAVTQSELRAPDLFSEEGEAVRL